MMAIDYGIEPCTLKDIHQLQTLSIKTFGDTFGNDNSDDNMQHYFEDAYSVEQLTTEIKNPDSFTYFLKVDNKIAGYLKLNIDSAQTEDIGPKSLEIQRIYVDTDYKHHGFGRHLFEKAISVAIEHHKQFIWLGAWEHNLNSLEFYEHLGLKPFGEHVFDLGGDKQRDILLKKVI
ncbi:GNAT family N-acetyltransferase [Lactobacillaceae bacterium Scapto_B20]